MSTTSEAMQSYVLTDDNKYNTGKESRHITLGVNTDIIISYGL